MYLFTWPSPVMDGKLKSCHALELPFMWDALDTPGLSMLTGDGPERQAIADEMHARWIAFGRTGDPGWPAYDLDRRATQVFDVDSRVVDDPQGAERALWDGAG
jgi:para-nitrobenzyl esterase